MGQSGQQMQITHISSTVAQRQNFVGYSQLSAEWGIKIYNSQEVVYLKPGQYYSNGAEGRQWLGQNCTHSWQDGHYKKLAWDRLT